VFRWADGRAAKVEDKTRARERLAGQSRAERHSGLRESSDRVSSGSGGRNGVGRWWSESWCGRWPVLGSRALTVRRGEELLASKVQQ
jgi:hypothetical protein